MSEHVQKMDDATMRFGLLMEAAQAHQRMAETHLEKLRAHTQDLDAVVRDEIRRTLIEEMHTLTEESQRTIEAFKRIRPAARLRGALWMIATALICTGVPSSLVWWASPSAAEIAALRSRHQELSANIEKLERQGARIVWRRCGETSRLCFRVDLNAPAYGEKADYFVVAGY
ncbi:MAG: hypothetical protein NVS9B2_14690 [Steroidobacteraceae bacterium]